MLTRLSDLEYSSAVVPDIGQEVVLTFPSSFDMTNLRGVFFDNVEAEFSSVPQRGAK
jgi:hypothetical protein